MKKKLLILFFVIVSFSMIDSAIGGITFTDGKWETTFNFDEQTQFNGTLGDGLIWGTNWYFDEHRSQITSEANNSNGGGGRGARFWAGDGSNQLTGVIGVLFSNQKELWIRWYQRYQSGFSWSELIYDKTIYIRSAGTPAIIPEFYGGVSGGGYVLIAQSTPDYYQVVSNHGWDDVMGGSTGDGEFHCYEIHIKMDTDGTNGIGRLWIDGVLRASNTSVNWSGGDTNARNGGWREFGFHENHSSPTGGPYYVDYDDMTIYNTTPPNQDEDGNYFIGPIGWTEEDETAPAVTSASVNGSTVTVNFDETVVTTGYDSGDFDLDCSVTGNNISLSSPSGTGTSRTFTAASAVVFGETCNLDYTGGANDIEDAAGNDLAQFTDKAVTNNTPDTTNPSVTFTTTSPQDIESDSLAISGTASDNDAVTGCKYRIGSAPNASNGTAIAWTTSWSGTATGFSEGENTLHVGCTDAAGNWGSDSITVNLDTPEEAKFIRSYGGRVYK